MPASPKPLDGVLSDLRGLINADATELSSRLRLQQVRDFPPSAEKTLRRFTPAEASRFIGIAEGYLRQLVAERKESLVSPTARRTYSIEEIGSLRRELDASGKGIVDTYRTEKKEKRCKSSQL